MDKIQELRASLPRRERRVIPGGAELRTAAGAAPKIGMRIPFGKRSEDMGFTEIIDPGAFTKTLQEPGCDVVSLWSHLPEYVLGRQSNRTLAIAVGADALDGAVTLDPGDTDHANFARRVERRDVLGSSFGFETVRQEWLEEENPDGSMTVTRTLLEVKLYEISPVVFPAYPDSESETRALGEARSIERARKSGIDPVEFVRVLAGVTDGRVEARHAESVRRWIHELTAIVPAPALVGVPLELRQRKLAHLMKRHGLAA